MRHSVAAAARRFRVPVLLVTDTTAWLIAMFLTAAARLTHWGAVPELRQADAGGAIPIYGLLIVGALAAAAHGAFAFAFRLHQGRARLGSFEEVLLIASVAGGAGLLAFIFNATVFPPFVPRTVPLAAASMAIILCFLPRAIWRMFVQKARPADEPGSSKRVVIIGAGEGGCQLVESMQRDPRLSWLPVGFVDDDPRKKHLRHRGVRVLGPIQDLPAVARHHSVQAVVLAIPSADSDLVLRTRDLAQEAGLRLKVLPPVGELLEGASHHQIRDLQPTDLLGRHQIDTDVREIAGYLAGRRVLVTGAGGSIGSELCRQIQTYEPAELILLDRDESALHSLVLSLDGRADLESPRVVLADIRDVDRIHEVFAQRRPDVVFHAAALKHVNVLEQHPSEAWKTNVLGTANVLSAASSSGVGRFVNISTDKAADPENALGLSKRIAEGLTAQQAALSMGTYLSVRFGNVLGTRGSVLKTFESQIKAGHPVTVTHPDATRYFMTVNEAVQLVIQAAAIGCDGEALLLDMGEPVRIMDVATKMIDHFGADVPITVTGLKPGEKLHEVLFGTGEPDNRPIHPLVSHVSVPPTNVGEWRNGMVPVNVMQYMRTTCEEMLEASRAELAG